MNILLIGEYSRLHNSLKEGLQQLGHHVVIFGFKDGFKDFPVDFPLYKKWDRGFLGKLKVALFRLTGFDASSYFTYRQFLKYRNRLTGFDVVQLINENSLQCQPAVEQKILKFLFANNKKSFLLSCGDDYANVNFNFANPEIKSVVQPYLAGKIADVDFLNALKYKAPEFKKLHDFIYEHIAGVMASDLDYVAALEGHSKYLGLIPNPVNTDKIEYVPLPVSGKIVIFLGINIQNYYKKGSDYFEQALEIVRNKYPQKTATIITRNVPYKAYHSAYDKAHILLDQAFSIDQGYNALEAMARGKVVFTGAEKAFTYHYHLTENVNINAVADVQMLVDQLSRLIENPAEIESIGKRARIFIEKEHHYIKIAEKYLSVWHKKNQSDH